MIAFKYSQSFTNTWSSMKYRRLKNNLEQKKEPFSFWEIYRIDKKKFSFKFSSPSAFTSPSKS